ncbi:M23 family metallopeptidase [Polyangium sp. 15x6]|uniref:M23 family metallopeptidase n=1 Tax=Polyangium sp. 15x6 TaxID=3042687 RepID=UPI00249C4126|nr:M23 family metallopeptidase [Polyangium sp. 15x6]MDI3284591.1 M23 family metallopeptidase [Polyangium sp. 15x6]
MKSLLSRGASVLVSAGALVLAGCGADGPVVWPISGATEGDFPLSSTFGPRVRTEDDVYDFHRGIDIAVPEGTDVYSIAAGVVSEIQEDTSAGGMLVKVDHGGYYSTYVHCSEVDVDVGDRVDAGEAIAESGKASNGFAHLHFEIRKPGDNKKDCVHPLDVLPYSDRGAPTLEIGKVDMTTPLEPKITVRARVPAGELDLRSVSVATFEADAAAILEGLEPLSERVYDIEDWNRTYTSSESDVVIDDPNNEGILVRPQRYNNTMSAYEIDFTFTGLVGTVTSGMLRVRAVAVDVKGNKISVESQ